MTVLAEQLRWSVDGAQLVGKTTAGEHVVVDVRPADDSPEAAADARAVARFLASAAQGHRVPAAPSLPGELSAAMRETVETIGWWWSVYGYGPSLRALASALGVTPPTIQYRLDQLEQKHHLVERAPGEHNSVRLVPAAAEWATPN